MADKVAKFVNSTFSTQEVSRMGQLAPIPVNLVPLQSGLNEAELAQQLIDIATLGGFNEKFNRRYLGPFLSEFFRSRNYGAFVEKDVNVFLRDQVYKERERQNQAGIIWNWTPWRQKFDEESGQYDSSLAQKMGSVSEKRLGLIIPGELSSLLRKLIEYVPRDMIFFHITDYQSANPHRFMSVSALGVNRLIFAHWLDESEDSAPL